MHERRQGLERLLALPLSGVLDRLSVCRTWQIVDHDPLAPAGFWFCRFPQIHTRARYLKALVCVEDPLDVFAGSHVHDTNAERMALLIPHHLSEHHGSERDKRLAELVIGAKKDSPLTWICVLISNPPGEAQRITAPSTTAQSVRRIHCRLLTIAHLVIFLGYSV